MAARFRMTKAPERASGQMDISLLPGETRPTRSLAQFSPDNPEANIPRINKTPPNKGQPSEVEMAPGTTSNIKPTGGTSTPSTAPKPEPTNISQAPISESLARKPVPLKSRKDINIMEKLAEGNKIDRKDIAKAGRSLQKKGKNPNSVYPKIKGNTQEVNNQGYRILSEILNNPDTTVAGLGRGGVEFRSPNGWGIRYNKNGSFSGFVEP